MFIILLEKKRKAFKIKREYMIKNLMKIVS